MSACKHPAAESRVALQCRVCQADLLAQRDALKDALMDIAYVLPPSGESFVDYVDRIARAALAKVGP